MSFTNFKNFKNNPDMGQVKDILPEDLLSEKSTVALIDVREPDEYTGELGHIPGAQLITLSTLPQRLSEVTKEKTVVFICRSGARSARAAAFALDNGYSHVYNLKGGMILWNEKKYQVEK